MATYPIPPWLAETAQPAAFYGRGLQVGAQIGSEIAAQRLAQQQLMRQAQQDAIDQSYRDQMLQMKVDETVRRQRAYSQYKSMLDSGASPEQAIIRLGPEMGESVTDLLRYQQMAAAQKEVASQRFQNQAARADLEDRKLAMRGKELDMREKNNERLRDRFEGRISDADKTRIDLLKRQVTEINKGLEGLKPESVEAQRIQARAENAELQIRSILGKYDAPKKEQPAAPSSPQGQRVRVKSPGGKVGTIPADQLDAALNEGYTTLE